MYTGYGNYTDSELMTMLDTWPADKIANMRKLGMEVALRYERLAGELRSAQEYVSGLEERIEALMERIDGETE